MRISRIQYTLQPDFVEQNKLNIQAVMNEMRALNNPDVMYASYVFEDGKTFMHLVHDSSDGAAGIPANLDSFKHFQAQLKDHFEIPPKVESLELAGSSFLIPLSS